MKRTTWITGALAALSCCTGALACHGHGTMHHSVGSHGRGHLMHGHGEHGPGHLDEMADMLELSGEQRTAVAAVLTASLPNLQARGEALVAALDGQVQAVHSSSFDEAAIRSAAGQLASANEELAVAAGALLRDIHAELTPEQLEVVAGHGKVDIASRATEHMGAFVKMAGDWAERQ